MIKNVVARQTLSDPRGVSGIATTGSVDGYAWAHHGAPRYTGDPDLLVHATSEDARRILESPATFGFDELGLTAEDFCAPDRVVPLGNPPVRIDLPAGLDGVSWDDERREADTGRSGGEPVTVIGRAAFIANERASGRAVDLADLEGLGGS